MDFKEEIVKILKPIVEIDKELIEIPPNPQLGDYAIPCFKFAKQFRKSPVQIAEEIAQKIKDSDIFVKITNDGPYLNFFANKQLVFSSILSKIHSRNFQDGETEKGNGENIVVDFSSPNIAKSFGIAHIRSTVIGNSICKIYQALGYNVIGINHLGDWGTQFGKLMTAYSEWGDLNRLEDEGIDYLVEIYIEFGEKAENNPTLYDRARERFKALENGEDFEVKLWQKFRDLSLVEFNKYYDVLGIKFDYTHGESFYNDQLEKTIELVTSKIETEMSDGALIIDLKEENIKTPLMLRKSDGATTYHTRDLAAALYRLKEYNPTKIIYVVGTPQALHFQQLFKTLGMMGEEESRFVHVNFGNMTYEGQMMSTRKGNFIALSEVINKAITRAEVIIEEKNPSLKNKDKIAKQVAIGSVIFADLFNDRINDIEFSWEKAINFRGETAPYIQYTHARICSIERKANAEVSNEINYDLLSTDIEFELTKALGQFPETINTAAKIYKPSIIANYLIMIAQLFNKFYEVCHVINEPEDLRNARLLLADCTRIVLENGLNLLGIEAPSMM